MTKSKILPLLLLVLVLFIFQCQGLPMDNESVDEYMSSSDSFTSQSHAVGNELICCICNDDILPGNECASFDCPSKPHFAHGECLQELLRHERFRQPQTCPHCRSPHKVPDVLHEAILRQDTEEIERLIDNLSLSGVALDHLILDSVRSNKSTSFLCLINQRIERPHSSHDTVMSAALLDAMLDMPLEWFNPRILQLPVIIQRDLIIMNWLRVFINKRQFDHVYSISVYLVHHPDKDFDLHVTSGTLRSIVQYGQFENVDIFLENPNLNPDDILESIDLVVSDNDLATDKLNALLEYTVKNRIHIPQSFIYKLLKTAVRSMKLEHAVEVIKFTQTDLKTAKKILRKFKGDEKILNGLVRAVSHRFGLSISQVEDMAHSFWG